jgi:tRNA threonylcarbamoyladenosine biosynthesis protein TsaB
MTNEPLILAMETATRAGSVSLALGDQILASVAGDASSSHSNDLIENIEKVLRDGGRELNAVDVFAAAIGPGSFTGLRIGLATTKSLAMSLEKKCAGISTLAAVAVAAGESKRTVALLPAGRGEVFAQMFSVKNGNVDELDTATHIAPQKLAGRYGQFRELLWAGEGAHLQLQTLRDDARDQNIEFDSANGWAIAAPQDKVADAVAKLAMQEWRDRRLIRPQDLHANYLRASDAEIKNNA